MAKRATIRDVAKLAGVSVSTAGRVIGEYGYVSEEKRRLVRDAIAELSYTPNVMAQSLRTSHMKTIGIVLGDIRNPFFSRLLFSIEAAARQYGYSTLVCNTNNSVELEVELLQVLYSKRVDGIILVSSYKSGQSIRPEHRFLYEGEIPVVFADRNILGPKGSVVSIDNWQGGFDGTSYLLRLGHRRIGIVAPPRFVTVEGRIAGCVAAFKEHGVTFDPRYLFRDNGDRRKLSLWMDSIGDATAIFTLNSDALQTLVSKLGRRRKRIPEDMSLLCWDDCDIACFVNCSVVEQPVMKMGSATVERLMMRLKGAQPPPDDLSLQVQLIERGSCKSPPDHGGPERFLY